MIHLIYGSKGTGKAKRILEDANKEVESAKGNIVFIDKDNRKMFELARAIRLVDMSEYNIIGETHLAAFVKGLLAGNRDIETVFIDGISGITNLTPENSEKIYSELNEISEKFNIKFVITVTVAKEPPEFFKKYKLTKLKAV